MKRYSAQIDESLPILGIDLGYSAKLPSCGFAHGDCPTPTSVDFGGVIGLTRDLFLATGIHIVVLEAVLSTYHAANGNPDIRGSFEKGRGWYHGPGVTTYAAAVRFLSVLDKELPHSMRPVPLVEGFLSFKKARSAHSDDADRLVREFSEAERFVARSGSEPILSRIDGVPLIYRYNKP